MKTWWTQNMTTFTIRTQILISQSVFLIVGGGKCFWFLILHHWEISYYQFIILEFLKKLIREALIECFFKKNWHKKIREAI
jgi:hypothetical protein